MGTEGTMTRYHWKLQHCHVASHLHPPRDQHFSSFCLERHLQTGEKRGGKNNYPENLDGKTMPKDHSCPQTLVRKENLALGRTRKIAQGTSFQHRYMLSPKAYTQVVADAERPKLSQR